MIPSRLPDGQVVFLLPSHYVQLAAAAAANGISIGPNPPTAIWATTNMSLLGGAGLPPPPTDKLVQQQQHATTKRLHGGDDWPEPELQAKCPSGKTPRIELAAEQPLDFTTTTTGITTSASAGSSAKKPKSQPRYLDQPSGSREEKLCKLEETTVVKDQLQQEEGMWRPW